MPYSCPTDWGASMVWVAFLTFMIASVGSSVFALWKGDAPERYGGCLRLGVIVFAALSQFALVKSKLSIGQWLPVFDLTSTAILAFGFLYLALKFGSNWLAAAMIIQGCEFYTDRVFLDSGFQRSTSYQIQENLIATGVALCLLLATISSIRRRLRLKLAEALRTQKEADRMARIEALMLAQTGAGPRAA